MPEEHGPPGTWWEEVGQMKVDYARFCENTARRIESLEQWKIEQNGDIRDIRREISSFRASSQKWLVGVLTSLLLSLAVLVINLLVSIGGTPCP